ncbi:hypothetical protein [Agrobacterium deltaense]|uniref:hypothetical protein n=1 Tax=Agrobacterium deltaense TaxID=1183412 RepID=UPI0009B9FBBA|nr:hypothetical protein [Agrobacterium deltaense]
MESFRLSLLNAESDALAGKANAYCMLDGNFVDVEVAVLLGHAGELVSKLEELFVLINSVSRTSPSLEVWNAVLPKWFIEACAPEATQDQLEEEMSLKRSMIFEEWVNMMNSKPWSVSSWVYWFEPARRNWFWNKGKEITPKNISLNIFTIDHPLTTDSLRWAVKTAGGEVKSIDC